MRHLAVCLLSFALLLVLSASATGQPTTQRFPGDVVALNGRHLELRIGSGEVVTVQLADNVRVSARSAASLAAIAPGTYIGTAAVPRADGTLTAVEVHVFPEAMRGTVGETAPVVMIEPRRRVDARPRRPCPGDSGETGRWDADIRPGLGRQERAGATHLEA